MNDTAIDLGHYVDEVRRQLVDLPGEVRDELTEELAADLAELVEERGSEALPSPEHYAAELRSAAGLGPAGARPRREWALSKAAMEAIDAAHAHADRLLDALPGDVRGLVSALQPVWWVVRAWVAWMVTADARGVTFGLWDGSWLTLLAVYVLVSVQLGRRRWRLDTVLDRSVLARLFLVGLNVLAVVLLPGAVDQAAGQIAENRAWMYTTYDQAEPVQAPFGTVTYEGRQACVLQVFDADGKRIKGGYVWDATGHRRLPMNNRHC